MASHPEVVILGAGLAGMTAAYHLRDRDVVVIESRDRVGGRTLSGEHDGYWYNSGAQFVSDARTVALCSELGLDVLGGEGALSAVFVNGKLAIAPDPNRLFMKMPVPWVEKARFALTITRLRRIASRMHGLDADLDAKSLAEVIGPTSDITRDILEMATTSGTGLSTQEVSGAIGLGYAIHLFGGDVNSTLKAVRGGTQQIPKAIAEAIDPERLMLECKVESVTASGGGVKVRYRRGEREPEEVEASICISAMTADDVLERATTRVERWRGLPRFGKGWLGRQKVLREPFGRIHFCGDYTAQPGTPGAVGSGYHAARTVRALLG